MLLVVGQHDKEIRALIETVLGHGWVEVTGKRYYKFRCPCGKHQKTIHKSPSDPNYVRNTLKWFERQECWEEGEQDA
ncbi:hypothetical protein CKJ55_07230 [Mycobacterium avium]|uniref:Type II toxin-antitoxin system HicA family toxin n=1 Tax=Mycobacterium avium TaxID=1764 RepID=A0A2A2ZLX2_MYCAV|nr:hypothetical protein CKJ66_08770 [Mycobacterium avium]PBA51655.1 hypothetical protein CKJ59_08045 [Mycobacterium avium]PBA67044.1 hypothetical protein CKJ55_07230 [Mycobacterium avium]